MAKTDPTKPYPQRAGLPPPRTPRTRTMRATIPSAPYTTPLSARQPVRPPLQDGLLQDGLLQNELLQGEQRRWFEGEVGALRQLARTERLLGDYVAAQRLSRELDAFIAEVAALSGQGRG